MWVSFLRGREWLFSWSRSCWFSPQRMRLLVPRTWPFVALGCSGQACPRSKVSTIYLGPQVASSKIWCSIGADQFFIEGSFRQLTGRLSAPRRIGGCIFGYQHRAVASTRCPSTTIPPHSQVFEAPGQSYWSVNRLVDGNQLFGNLPEG